MMGVRQTWRKWDCRSPASTRNPPRFIDAWRMSTRQPLHQSRFVAQAVALRIHPKCGVPKWNELLKCKCDIDATLQELMDNRLVWNEARFCFVQERDKNLGGNSLYRSEERIATEKRHLKRKWKGHIRLETYKSQDRTAIDVRVPPVREAIAKWCSKPLPRRVPNR